MTQMSLLYISVSLKGLTHYMLTLFSPFIYKSWLKKREMLIKKYWLNDEIARISMIPNRRL